MNRLASLQGLAIALACIAPSAALRAQEAVSTVVAKAAKAVVLITSHDVSGNLIGQGSGFLVGQTGNVATNQHVIDGAASLIVKLSSGAYYEVVDAVRIDCTTDLAVLQIKHTGEPLPYLQLAAEGTQVGDAVIAIGTPLTALAGGLTEATVSNGIVGGVRHWEQKGINLLQFRTPRSLKFTWPLLSRSGSQRLP
jgi:S1-C subfamily serine protease